MSSRVATDQIRDHFASREADALNIDVPGIDVKADHAKIDAFAKRLAAVPNVSRVDALTGEYLVIKHKVIPVAAARDRGTASRRRPVQRGTYLSVVPTVDPLSSQGARLAKNLRAAPAPFHFLVAGSSARLVDTKKAVISRLPLALGLVAFATYVLLFLMTGSLLVPLKALVLNMLTLTATFGATVWIFQDGHFANTLNITPYRNGRYLHSDPFVLYRFRSIHGLRGLPALPYQGGVGPRA